MERTKPRGIQILGTKQEGQGQEQVERQGHRERKRTPDVAVICYCRFWANDKKKPVNAVEQSLGKGSGTHAKGSGEPARIISMVEPG